MCVCVSLSRAALQPPCMQQQDCRECVNQSASGCLSSASSEARELAGVALITCDLNFRKGLARPNSCFMK